MDGLKLFAGSVLSASLLSHSKRMDSGSVTVSAPGKALVAGGYLVLEHPNCGVVVSCTSRFYTTVKALEGAVSDKIPSGEVQIRVESTQFFVYFEYSYNPQTNTLKQTGEVSNEFVEKCLGLVLSYIRRAQGEEAFTASLEKNIGKGNILGIKLRADNDFYSQIEELEKQGKPLLSKSLRTLPRFIPCPRGPDGKVKVAKTGMGSSAALTTSLVAALLKFFGVISLAKQPSQHSGGFSGALDRIQRAYRTYIEGEGADKLKEMREEDRRIVHNLAQLAHANAQGKIGSGFDVAAAVYGTQMYRRFSSSGFDACMGAAPSPEVVYKCVMDKGLWGQTITPLSLPGGFDMVMGDVCGGSESTSMAKMVLKWRKDDKSAPDVWDELAQLNTDIYEKLSLLVSFDTNMPRAYRTAIDLAAGTISGQWENIPDISNPKTNGTEKKDEKKVLCLLVEIRELFLRARKLLKLMGDMAGVGIEPDSQTALVDATIDNIPGVLCAGVPGAGGVDAVFAISLSSTARQKVEDLWSQWKGEGPNLGTRVCPLVLGAETDSHMGGVRVERLGYA